MNRWATCLKWLVFSFNLLFWLCGLGVLGGAIFLRVNPNTHPFFTEQENAQRYYIAMYALMSIGIFMAILGFLGSCGALKESRGMLGTYFGLLCVVVIAEVAGGVMVYMYRNNFTRTFVENGFAEIVRNEYGKPGFEARSQYFDIVQTEFDCCGAKSSWDWFQSEWHGGNGDIGSNGTQEYLVPLSCCKRQFRTSDPRCIPTDSTVGVTQSLLGTNTDIINERGCGAKLMDAVDANRDLVVGVGVAVAIFQIFGLLFSIVLCCTIKPDSTYEYKSR
ncbi:hypothetical protein RvY_09553 [Ramazzottius varieornatus]|uniref:Tetraspanin n=1 Tax=Ramazzottius varieornatus TaxID=947166 RepID=A0A1D1V9N7_RAMVA|nr:hypothetical protein RvY_09553 [Ramazzottius varieornatus]